MTAKEFLRKARHIDRRIDETTERLERMRERLEAGRRATLTDMPRGGGTDWTDIADQAMELERRLHAQAREYVRLKLAAQDAIAQVEDARLREVLELYYIDAMTWDQVAHRMVLDLRWVYRLHGRALLKISVPREFDH